MRRQRRFQPDSAIRRRVAIKLSGVSGGWVHGASRRSLAWQVRGPRQLARLGLLLAASGLIASCTAQSPEPPPRTEKTLASSALGPPAPCMTEYRALLDLADLARRYGPSAGVFLDPLGDMFGQLDDCLAAAQGEGSWLGADMVKIGTDGAATGAHPVPFAGR